MSVETPDLVISVRRQAPDDALPRDRAAAAAGGELAALRGEAAALHERSVQLRSLCDALERQLAHLLASERTPQAAALRGRVRETLRSLEETLRRRRAIRARIAALENEEAAERGERSESAEHSEVEVRSEGGRRAQNGAVTAPAPPAAVPDGAAHEALPASVPGDAASVLGRVVPAVEAPASSGPTDLGESVSDVDVDVVAAPQAEPEQDAAWDAWLRPETERVAAEREVATTALFKELDSLESVLPKATTPEAEGSASSRWRRAARWAARVFSPAHAGASALAVVLAVLAVLLTPLPEVFGWQLFAVLSGSMEPALPVGSVIFVKPVDGSQLKVGDVITFADRGRPDVRVTHRIVNLESSGGQTVATTKGDANNTSDTWNVPVDRAVGRVELHVPYGGYLMYWLGSPPVKTAALGLALILFLAPTFHRRRPAPPVASGVVDQPPANSYDSLEQEIESLLGSRGPAPGARGR